MQELRVHVVLWVQSHHAMTNATPQLSFQTAEFWTAVLPLYTENFLLSEKHNSLITENRLLIVSYHHPSACNYQVSVSLDSILFKCLISNIAAGVANLSSTFTKIISGWRDGSGEMLLQRIQIQFSASRQWPGSQPSTVPALGIQCFPLTSSAPVTHVVHMHTCISENY